MPENESNHQYNGVCIALLEFQLCASLRIISYPNIRRLSTVASAGAVVFVVVDGDGAAAFLYSIFFI